MRVRRPLRIPNVPGFLTLQCDFHTHTVFSDGQVWPDTRSEEAWREGYDAIAITDHVEYQPHRKDLPTNYERSWEIAAPHGAKLGVIVIRGSEITRKMPPGHLKAHAWALEKGLTILANSDSHDPVNLAWHVSEGDHRPVTLVRLDWTITNVRVTPDEGLPFQMVVDVDILPAGP